MDEKRLSQIAASQKWQPTPDSEITATTDVITVYGTVRLCWKGNDMVHVRLAAYDYDANRRTTVRRYMPPHPEGQRLISQMLNYFQGKEIEFDLPIPEGVGTEVQRKVWQSMIDIGYGNVETVGDLALRLGLPVSSARGIGQIIGQNPLPIIFPDHRIVTSTGALTGFAAGIGWKQGLLELEGVEIKHGKIRVFKTGHF